jgi:prepilin-type N-terminal cleavage/methylation domain-containing protein
LKTGMGKGYLKNRLKRFLSLEGFTLIEIMVVVIIIGILSAIAIPLYSKMIENSRITEATQMLGALRDAEMKYAFEYGNYTAFNGALGHWYDNLKQLGVDFNGTGKYFYIVSIGQGWANPYNNIDESIAVAGRNAAGGSFRDYFDLSVYDPFLNMTGIQIYYMIFINESGRLWSYQPNVDKAVRNY